MRPTLPHPPAPCPLRCRGSEVWLNGCVVNASVFSGPVLKVYLFSQEPSTSKACLVELLVLSKSGPSLANDRSVTDVFNPLVSDFVFCMRVARRA